ncbi:MAG: peptidyl-prolyl cis-trans isomerase [Maritimibacter sp.]
MSSKISRGFVWILLGLVLIGMIGFGSFNFGGTSNSIGSVGDTDISADTYYRELNADIRAFESTTGATVTIALAQQIGLTENALNKVISSAAMENETARLGISVGDLQLTERIRQIPGFAGPSGTFDRETYDFILEQSGLNASEFEEGLRDEVARTVLQTAVSTGVTIQPIYTNELYTWAREARSFTWAALTEVNLEGELPAPTPEELAQYYEANPTKFTAPETKDITYVWLSPEAMVPTIELEEATIRAAYDARINEFQTPELRMAERLVFPSTEDAAAAAARLAANELSFEELVAERGLTLADVDMGDPVAQVDVAAAMGEAMFGAQVGNVVGPVDSGLGPALVRVNAVIDASQTSYEEAKADLRDELAADAARRLVADLAIELDEMLAGGATLEEVAETFPSVTLEQIDWFFGLSDGIAAYDEFRTRASETTADDFPEIEVLEDESLLALRVNGITPSRLQPLDEVREAVVAGWAEVKTNALLNAQADAMIEKFSKGESPASLGLTEIVETDLPREAFIAGTPSDFVATVFALNANEWTVIPADDGAVLVRVDAINAPDATSAEALEIKATFEARMGEAIGADILAAFSKAIEDQAGIDINRPMIDAVHTNFP